MRRWMRWGLLILLAAVCAVHRPAAAQGRLSDKDLQRAMQTLKDDAQPFKQTFANALKNSTIHKSTQEKDARALADAFAKEANAALDAFKRNKKADAQVAALVHTASQIDPLVYNLHLDPGTTTQWEKLRSELHPIAQAFSVPEPYFSSAAGNAAAAQSTTGTCLNAVGIQRSRQLVNECLQVSPATHPPCNAQNACSMIVDEIKRGCALIGKGAPGFCAEYQ